MSKLNPGVLAPLAAIALIALFAFLAMPAVASAQDPAVDQYAPTAPDGGGSVPAAPVPNTDEGNLDGGGSTAPADASSSGGSGGESSTPVDPAAAPTDSGNGGSAPADSLGANTGESGNKDKDTLEGLAANASQQREDAGAPRTESPATELLRSDSGGDLGMGVFLWAVLGVTALWAVATVVRRRQDQDGHPA